jgi:hypothetical protein
MWSKAISIFMALVDTEIKVPFAWQGVKFLTNSEIVGFHRSCALHGVN